MTYADPACEIDISSIGGGNQSHTSEVQMQQIETSFPLYRVYEAEEDQDQSASPHPTREVAMESLLRGCAIREYKTRIDRMDNLVAHKDKHSVYPECLIRVFDTPGLEDTNSYDERNVAKILTSLSSENAVHLVLIAVSSGNPLTPGLVEALKTYSKIFSAMGGLLAIVHTKFEYRTQHPDDKKTVAFMKERAADLDRIMGRNMTHFMLDCDLDEDRPIHIYLRQTTIRNILLAATHNTPVALNTMQLYKTSKMQDVDALTARQQSQVKADLEEQRRHMEEEQRKRLADASDLERRINETRGRIRGLDVFINKNETDELVSMREERFENGFNFFAIPQEVELKAYDLPYKIDHVEVHCDGVRVLHQDGGYGHHHWYVKFVRFWHMHGIYHAKLFVKRRNKMHQEINQTKAELERCNRTKDDMICRRSEIIATNEFLNGPYGVRRELEQKQGVCSEIIAQCSRETLTLDLFNALVKGGVYENTPAECMDKVSAFYAAYSHAEA
ncbi:hypothetical protein BGZ54_009056 [Gamsiella multidivaricata]|nr:hypothetical protein BGZ54_009056 [Gamsiella multidivaricata]